MSDSEFSAFVREMRAAIQELKQDVRRIETDLIEAKVAKTKRKWWHL